MESLNRPTRILLAVFASLLALAVIDYGYEWIRQGRSSPASTAAHPAPTPIDNRITLEKYHRLQTGMIYGQAIEILGKPGTEMSRTEMGGTSSVAYAWDGNAHGEHITAMFQNGKLIGKAQVGLR